MKSIDDCDYCGHDTENHEDCEGACDVPGCACQTFELMDLDEDDEEEEA